MIVYFNDVNKNQYLENLNISERECLEEFDNLSQENGSFFGIKDDNDKVLQFFCENEKLFLIDIPNPPSFVNYQKWASKDECKKIISEIYANNKIIIVNGMVEVPIKEKTLNDIIK